MLSNGPDDVVNPLTSCQDQILSDFFDRYIAPDLNIFIHFGAVTAEEQVVRAFLVFSTFYLEEPVFLRHLNAEFPPAQQYTLVSDKINYLRNKLINLCSLCHESIDINHPLYQWVFDKRLADSPKNSPTKKKMVRNSLLNLIRDEMESLGYTYQDCLNSELVSQLKQVAEPILNAEKEPDPTVRRKLFF